MIRYVLTERVPLPPEKVYDYVVNLQEQNHPKWEPEVIELRRHGPPARGTRGVMVRKDFGRVVETPLEWLEVEPNKRVRFASDAKGVRFDLAIDFEPAEGDATDVRGTIEVTLSGGMRLLQPLLGGVFRKNSRRILARLRELLEEEGRRT
jgi:uncharacterized protein YndB with AHSA1/START domain